MQAWNKSKCVNQWYHRFNVISETPMGVLEMCQICKKKVFFKVVQDKLDNFQYIAHHNRQALLPIHPKFAREYGKI